MNALSTSEIRSALSVYGYSATSEYCEKVRVYVDLLLRWNRKVALTSVTEPREILSFHFGESLFGMKVAGMGDVENCRLADLGAGAGFPGMPIAMSLHAMNVTLIESNGKKAAFLAEIKRELRLENVSIHKGRAEDVSDVEKFEFVTARALGSHEDWLLWSAKRLTQDGRVVLWLNSEGVQKCGRIPGWKWADPAKIPRTRDRFVAFGSLEQG